MSQDDDQPHSKEFTNKLAKLVAEGDAMDRRTMMTRSMQKKADEHLRELGEHPPWLVDRWIEEHVTCKLRHEIRIRKSGEECDCEICRHECRLCTHKYK